MATASKFSREETTRRVKHPLQLVRKYIRRYVILEGLALAILFVTVLFWLGLAFDFGLYKFDIDLIGIHGIDWLQELNDVDATHLSGYAVRAIFMIVFLVALVALGVTKVAVRWLRDFNDRAIALVLEKRFHKQLGDRLITAIELADPNLAKKYGFSQAMVEKTIDEAVDTLKKLPVASVFNWRRLFALWVLVGLSTVGILFLTMIAFCVGARGVQGEWMSPVGFAWRFSDAVAIWTERNLLMQPTYWPRRTHLEIARFQPAKGKPNDMNVAKDDAKARPELQVRAIIWVIADRDRQKAPNGWRALRWADLKDKNLVDPALLAVTIPEDFPSWKPDTDELEPYTAAAVFGSDFQGKTSGDMRAHMALPHAQAKIKERLAQKELDDWLNWQTWSMDKLAQQLAETDVRRPLRATNDLDKLDAIFLQLEVLASSPSMSRTLRKLETPGLVEVTFYPQTITRHDDGNETRRPTGNKKFAQIEPDAGNKFTIPLEELGEADAFRFRARGDDFYTPKDRFIVLVPAPAPASITIDTEEPAYVYHRLPYRQEVLDDPLAKGQKIIVDDQMPLQGRKHVVKDFALTTNGDTNSIDVKIGGSLVIHMRTDRELRAEKTLFPRDPPIIEPNFDIFRGTVQVDKDLGGFSIVMSNLTRKHDFVIEYFDKDNIRGRRRFRVFAVPDTEPQLDNLGILGYVPRRPKIKVTQVSDSNEPTKAKDPRDAREHEEISRAFLVTPDALVPFECKATDDYGLVRVGYHYKLRQVDFEMVAQGAKKLPALQINQATRVLHAGAIASIFQFGPGNPMSWRFGPDYAMQVGDIVQRDLRQSQGYREAFIPSDAFQEIRAGKKTIHLAALDTLLAKQRSGIKDNNAGPAVTRIDPWEFNFNMDAGFDVRRLALKTVDPEKIAQFHYLVQVSVQATDNNVETGAFYRDERGVLLRGNTKKNKNGYISFLVVSENELLSQIALEEETISEKLEVAKAKVDADMIALSTQHKNLADADADLENILIRMNDIRNSLTSVGNVVRDATQAYKNIRKEMEVNRVNTERISNMKKAIVFPLEDIVHETGSFAKAEDAFQKAHDVVSDDVSEKRKPDMNKHDLTVAVAKRDMKQLSEDIGRVLNAMNDGIVEAKLIAMLVTIEDLQRKKTKLLKDMLDDQEMILFKKLLEDTKDKSKPKEKDKELKEKVKETNSSALRPAFGAFASLPPANSAACGLAFACLNPKGREGEAPAEPQVPEPLCHKQFSAGLRLGRSLALPAVPQAAIRRQQSLGNVRAFGKMNEIAEVGIFVYHPPLAFL